MYNGHCSRIHQNPDGSELCSVAKEEKEIDEIDDPLQVTQLAKGKGQERVEVQQKLLYNIEALLDPLFLPVVR